ncbi:MAG: HEAT repeat domain-containing protein [Deltaproteobacteria bacterium]|nr:HEAT repeat domain-containing protein [Deltaproteobacteria bacterium]
MGLKTLFSKEGRQERALQKACIKAKNPKIKPDDRRPALEFLLHEGSEEAICSLLHRFTFNYDTNMVSDEDEKNLVYRGLLEHGAATLPALRKHLASAPTLSWGLRLLDEIADEATTWEILCEVAEHFEPGYDRDPSRKLQLLSFLAEIDDPRVGEMLLPYLQDHDEAVRFAVIDGLVARRVEAAREPLLEILVDEDEESLRIKNRIAEGLVETGWTVKGFRGSVEKALSEEYVLDGKGHVRHRRPRK